MPQIKRIDNRSRELLMTYIELDAECKKASSALNKHKTVLRNHIKAMFAENDYPFGSYFEIDGKKVAYNVAISDQISVEDLYEMLEQEQITKEQFFRCLKAQVGETKQVLGGDVVEALKQPVAGDTPDIRMEDLPVDQQGDDRLHVLDRPNVKRKVFGKKGTLTGGVRREQDNEVSRPRRLRLRRNGDG